MRPVDLIRKKRDGGEFSREEIATVVNGYTKGDIPDYQMSAWLMAVLLKGMNERETADLTEVMLRSGRVLDWSGIPGKKVDKHSTGGVGDKTSFLLVPIVAAGGLVVPMISGRGLAHSGGTLDKLESIPGFNVNLSVERFEQVLREIGCSMIGQTAEICPADKKIYALRDVTGTVESPSLICASIMCKKLAEGTDALVLDVKTGSGSFMKTEERAAGLARLMVQTGQRMGKRMAALLTDMDQPLGHAVGNSLEILECLELMRGERRPMSEDLREVSLELAAWMFLLGGRVAKVEDGRTLAEEMIASGKALAKFRDLLRLHGGGDISVVDKPSRLPKAEHTLEFRAANAGYVHGVQCDEVGVAALVLGGGREKKEDVIDHAVGLELHKKVGDRVDAGEHIATVYYNTDARLGECMDLLNDAYVIRPEPISFKRKLVQQVIQ